MTREYDIKEKCVKRKPNKYSFKKNKMLQFKKIKKNKKLSIRKLRDNKYLFL
jgi:hypothetical protein